MELCNATQRAWNRARILPTRNYLQTCGSVFGDPRGRCPQRSCIGQYDQAKMQMAVQPHEGLFQMAVNFTDCGTTVLKPNSMTNCRSLQEAQCRHIQIKLDLCKTFLNATASYENELLSFRTYDKERHRVAIGVFSVTAPISLQAAGLARATFTFGFLQDLVLAYCQRKTHIILPAALITV